MFLEDIWDANPPNIQRHFCQGFQFWVLCWPSINLKCADYFNSKYCGVQWHVASWLNGGGGGGGAYIHIFELCIISCLFELDCFLKAVNMNT